VIGDLDGELASRLAGEIDASGERVRGMPLDGADENDVKAIVGMAVDTFGRLDGMHVNFTNAADAYLPGGVVELPLEAFDEVMRVNTGGFVICAKHAIPAMSGGGAKKSSKAITISGRRRTASAMACNSRAAVKPPGVLTPKRSGAVRSPLGERAMVMACWSTCRTTSREEPEETGSFPPNNGRKQAIATAPELADWLNRPAIPLYLFAVCDRSCGFN
jgi:hypothetical protein